MPGSNEPSGDRPRRPEPAEQEPLHRRWAAALIVAGMAVTRTAAMLGIHRGHEPLPAVARYALQVSLPQWRLTEPVNEVVYGTRGFDTFGETFLLFAAIMSVVMITRPREPRRGYFGEEDAGAREQSETDPAHTEGEAGRDARSAERREQDEPGSTRHGPPTPDRTPLGTPAPETAAAMTVVTRTAIRAAALILAVAGLYLVAWGYSPGGGFPGGAVILGVVLLVYAGFGRRKISRVARPGLLEGLEIAGAATIIATELLGLILKGSFSANWLPLAPPQTILSGGVAQLFSVSELVEVGTGLAIAVFALLAMEHDWAPDEPDSQPDGKDGGSGQ
jgi:multicomponent Na+:H+ antiporter subunit B